ncbi:MAG TPA: porin family protein [Chitinophagaceae bacterium]|nr:porin family protein [Chitinophagaceae bacterium]
MNKTLLFAVLLTTGLAAHAQGVKWALFTGPQWTTVRYTIGFDEKKQAVNGKFGFVAGLSAKADFEGNLYFAPAVNYSMKGYTVTFNRISYPPDSLAIDNDVTMHTFEIAAHLQYDFSKQPGHFFMKGGPNIDLQLFGKEKFNRSDNTSKSRSMSFGYTEYGRFAGGLQLALGYETKKKAFVQCLYSHGFGSINNADHGPRIRYRYFNLSLGTYLGKKKG